MDILLEISQYSEKKCFVGVMVRLKYKFSLSDFRRFDFNFLGNTYFCTTLEGKRTPNIYKVMAC